jgi:hypothetical protein
VDPVTWPDEQLERDAWAVAAATSLLLAEEERWVHRRVESIEFLDARRVRRRTSVDFTLPTLPELVPGPAYVPVSLVRKEVLTAFDLCDEGGAALPLLTRRQNATIAAEMLVQQAREMLDELGRGPLLPDVEAGLRDVVGEDVVAPAPEPGSRESEQWEILYEDTWMGALLADLDEQFLLLVPVQDAPGRRRVLKFAYEQALEAEGGRLGGLLLSLGLRESRWRLAASALHDAESYHVEIVAPAELSIRSARLVTPPDRVLSEQADVARAHLYRSEPAGGVPGGVEFRFALRRALLWPVFSTAAGTAAILATGLVAHLGWGLRANEDAAAGLVVALPAFLAPFVAPGNHGLVRRMFQGLRVLALGSGVIAFAAAASLQLTLSARATTIIWFVLLWFALGATLLTLVALVGAPGGRRAPSDRSLYLDS